MNTPKTENQSERLIQKVRNLFSVIRWGKQYSYTYLPKPDRLIGLLPELKTAVRNDPDNYNLRSTLAQSLVCLNEFAAASEHLEWLWFQKSDPVVLSKWLLTLINLDDNDHLDKIISRLHHSQTLDWSWFTNNATVHAYLHPELAMKFRHFLLEDNFNPTWQLRKVVLAEANFSLLLETEDDFRVCYQHVIHTFKSNGIFDQDQDSVLEFLLEIMALRHMMEFDETPAHLTDLIILVSYFGRIFKDKDLVEQMLLDLVKFVGVSLENLTPDF